MQKTVDNQVKTDMLGKAAGPGRDCPQKQRSGPLPNGWDPDLYVRRNGQKCHVGSVGSGGLTLLLL